MYWIFVTVGALVRTQATSPIMEGEKYRCFFKTHNYGFGRQAKFGHLLPRAFIVKHEKQRSRNS